MDYVEPSAQAKVPGSKGSTCVAGPSLYAFPSPVAQSLGFGNTEEESCFTKQKESSPEAKAVCLLCSLLPSGNAIKDLKSYRVGQPLGNVVADLSLSPSFLLEMLIPPAQTSSVPTFFSSELSFMPG